ncbi:MAG: LLM class flavin-dependent oxidoreductase [Hyphomicrobiales bacterium]|nr:LLM class flavin-dependent oxidoreductase [Hyphomicrobiales bacterium]MBV8826188.1 LLM class flavin-dependent oxidoreductase [Hyphomicrobiales bacterium]MBV9429617.1 LLM class flavin-dependent oxidoreductase [Bradyrhizobiaceae bacterium]
MIKPWIFEFLPELGSPGTEPDPRDVANLFARYLDLWVHDEALGFEGIFFSEHHFGGSYSASPNLLIAALSQRTTRLRLGVMGVVVPYYHPARVVEEIGMLDHLTGGRLEIGTAIGVPQELSRLNMTMAEARERNDETVAIVDSALANRVISHRGKYFSFSDLRLLPRPLQQPSPPRWTTVVSIESARRAARRRIKISTGFNSTQMIKRIFDAYREEADAAGFHPTLDYLALRRRVTVGPTNEQARVYGQAVSERLKSFVAQDERLSTNVPDAPAPFGGFTLSDQEFVTGTAKDVAQNIIEQCHAVGAGHFLAVFNWSAPFDEVAQAHELFGREAIPLLRKA